MGCLSEQSFSYTGKSTAALGFDPSQEDGPGFESMATKAESLSEHLMNQLQLSDFDESERNIATKIIGALDEWDICEEPLEQIASDGGCSAQDAELVLRMIQEFDPAGVAARDLKECLLLQLKTLKFRFRSDKELLKQLFEDHLVNLEKRILKS